MKLPFLSLVHNTGLPLQQRILGILLACLFFAIPFRTDNSFFLLAALAAALWAIKGNTCTSLALSHSGRVCAWALGLFLGVSILSSLLHPESLRALPRTGIWLACAALGFLTARLLPRHEYRFFYAMTAALLLSAILGAGYWVADHESPILHDERLKLFAVHPSRLALYCAVCLFFCLNATFFSTTAKQRLMHLALCLFLLTALMLTNTRTLFLMLPVGMAGFLFALPRKQRKYFFAAACLCVTLASGFLALTAHTPTSQRLISAVSNIKEDSTFKSRLPIWEAGWAAFTDSPLIGNGQFSYKRLHKTYREAHQDDWTRRYESYEETVKQAHNIILGRLVDTGILGTAGFLCFFSMAILLAIKGPAHHRWVGLFLCYYFAIGLFDDPLWRMNDSFVFFLAATAIGANNKQATSALV